MTIRLAVLLSGSGSTLQNLIDRIAGKSLNAQISCVIASKAEAYGLERATAAGIPVHAVPRKEFSTQAEFNEAIWTILKDYEIDLIVLAGFMHLLDVPSAFHNRIMNVHPALIPAFCGHKMYGNHVHKAVLDYGAKITGATVHFVDAIYDNGPIILQQSVPVLNDDTVESLADRVQELERELYPRAIELYGAGRLRVDGRIVHISPEPGA
ncbi:MAG: phosphoribosylglycinamide formyltransferase [Candidatus Hydrogenedens sp.]|jgi:formyltetrahydrofolate-dependent phosphoribosylglycinamide formyltransferase|nr:phosphoribosylglycinamide formyltransferase [Candidatus Hydrogenedens sp.]